MNIRIRYETQITTIDVPEEEFDLMIRLDYEKQLAEAKDPATVRRRTPQEIFDERFNRPDYNNWHTFHRHWDADAVPQAAAGAGRRIAAEPDDDGQRHHFTMDEFPDLASLERQEAAERDEEVRAWIRKKLKPDYAEMLITIHMEGMSVTEYAAITGEKRNTVSHRLQRAEKKISGNFRKTSHMTLSRGYTTGGEKKASRRDVKQTAKNCPNETRNLITQTTRTPNKIHTPWVHTWAMDAT